MTQKLRLAPKSGGDLLQRLLEKVDIGAQKVHETWYSIKKAEMEDPLHPFRGRAPVGSRFAEMRRVRVRELTLEEARDLDITFDSTDNRDVYHSLFCSQDELKEFSTRDAGKNAIPVVSVLQSLATHFGQKVTIEQLEVAINGVLNPTSRQDIYLKDTLIENVHQNWMTGEIVWGERFPKNGDLILFGNLTDEKKSYDEYLMIPVLKWILEEIATLHRRK